MRVPFVHRFLGHRGTGAEPGMTVDRAESEGLPLPADLTGPVVLLPAKHITPQDAPTPKWWQRPSVVVTSVIVVFVLGTGTGIIVAKRTGRDSRSAPADASLRSGVSALTLPDDDAPLDTAIRDSVGNTLASRVVETPSKRALAPAPATRAAVSPRQEPVPSDPNPPEVQGRLDTPAAPDSSAARVQAIDSAVPQGAVSFAAPDSGPVRRVGEPAFPPAGLEQLAAALPPPQDTAQAERISPPASRESTLSVSAEARPRPTARPALMAGIVRLVEAISVRRGESAIRALLLDPASQQEVLRLVREQKPAASLGTADEVAIEGDEATLRVRVGLQWRGSFGVQERETRQFEAVAGWDGTGWEFTGIRILADVP